MNPPMIEVEQAGAVRRLWLARPAVRNAQSQQMLDDLDAAFRAAADDDATRVVLLGARGDHFSAGHDLKEAQARRADFTVEERWAYEQSAAHCPGPAVRHPTVEALAEPLAGRAGDAAGAQRPLRPAPAHSRERGIPGHAPLRADCGHPVGDAGMNLVPLPLKEQRR